jgi:hypothetical protein
LGRDFGDLMLEINGSVGEVMAALKQEDYPTTPSSSLKATMALA